MQNIIQNNKHYISWNDNFRKYINNKFEKISIDTKIYSKISYLIECWRFDYLNKI